MGQHHVRLGISLEKAELSGEQLAASLIQFNEWYSETAPRAIKMRKANTAGWCKKSLTGFQHRSRLPEPGVSEELSEKNEQFKDKGEGH